MTKLNITYKDGRGRLEINLDSLLPCTPADFKRLLSFVQLTDREENSLFREAAERAKCPLFSFSAPQLYSRNA